MQNCNTVVVVFSQVGLLCVLSLLTRIQTLQGQKIDLPEADRRSYSDCYQSDLLSSCNDNQTILVDKLYYGAKRNEGTCSLIYTDTEPDSCCQLEDDDCTWEPESRYFYERCSGLQQCNSDVTIPNELNQGKCNTSYLIVTQYLHMDFFCVDNGRIGSLCDAPSATQVDGQPYYLQNRRYPNTITSADTSCACSVESDVCGTTISVFVIHLKLSNSSGSCDQTITINSTEGAIRFQCTDNNYYTLSTRTINTSYITVTFENSAVLDSGKFWIGFYGEDKLFIDCPPKSKRYCLPIIPGANSTTSSKSSTQTTSTITSTPTTSTPTTTSSSTTTLTAPVLATSTTSATQTTTSSPTTNPTTPPTPITTLTMTSTLTATPTTPTTTTTLTRPTTTAYVTAFTTTISPITSTTTTHSTTSIRATSPTSSTTVTLTTSTPTKTSKMTSTITTTQTTFIPTTPSSTSTISTIRNTSTTTITLTTPSTATTAAMSTTTTTLLRSTANITTTMSPSTITPTTSNTTNTQTTSITTVTPTTSSSPTTLTIDRTSTSPTTRSLTVNMSVPTSFQSSSNDESLMNGYIIAGVLGSILVVFIAIIIPILCCCVRPDLKGSVKPSIETPDEPTNASGTEKITISVEKSASSGENAKRSSSSDRDSLVVPRSNRQFHVISKNRDLSINNLTKTVNKKENKLENGISPGKHSYKRRLHIEKAEATKFAKSDETSSKYELSQIYLQKEKGRVKYKAGKLVKAASNDTNKMNQFFDESTNLTREKTVHKSHLPNTVEPNKTLDITSVPEDTEGVVNVYPSMFEISSLDISFDLSSDDNMSQGALRVNHIWIGYEDIPKSPAENISEV